jgi:hypothetical protein
MKRALIFCLSVLMIVSLVSCSSVTPPDKVVESFFAHIKASEMEEMRALLVAPGSLVKSFLFCKNPSDDWYVTSA